MSLHCLIGRCSYSATSTAYFGQGTAPLATPVCCNNYLRQQLSLAKEPMKLSGVHAPAICPQQQFWGPRPGHPATSAVLSGLVPDSRVIELTAM